MESARVVTYGEARLNDPRRDESRPRTITAFVADPAAAPLLFDVEQTAGDLAGMGEGIGVRHDVGAANGRQIGDPLQLRFPDGALVDVSVAALFDGAVSTDWVLPRHVAEAHLPAAYREAFVKLADGVHPEALRPRLSDILDRYPAASLHSREELAAETAEANDTALGIITALFSLSLVVGVLGVVNTLTLAIVERIPEPGLLRAVGATRRQVRAMIRWEALLTSVLGAALGAVLGLSLAWVTAQALPSGTGAFTVPSWHIAAAVLITASLGVLARPSPLSAPHVSTCWQPPARPEPACMQHLPDGVRGDPRALVVTTSLGWSGGNLPITRLLSGGWTTPRGGCESGST